MYQKILNWIRRMLRNNTDHTKKSDVLISPKMESAISLWLEMYQNEAPWVDDKEVKSLNLACSVSSEFAKLITIEMESSLSGSKRAEFLSPTYEHVIKHLREKIEIGCALGGIIFKPYVSKGQICINYISADCFLPVAFDSSGNITSVIFYDQINRDNKIFTRVEFHELIGSRYKITNKAYVSNSSAELGREIELIDVPEWSEISSETICNNIKHPLFGYYRVAMANHIDKKSPLGVSVFSRAVDHIKEADKQFSRFLWEFEGGELAIDATEDCLHQREGSDYELPKTSKRLFRRVMGVQDDFYKVFSPPFRDESLANGLNKIYQRIEFDCGFAYGTLSDPQNVDKTAEEIRTSKQRSYTTVKDNQSALQTALEGLVYAMDVLTTIYCLAPEGEVKKSFSWGDSILTDTNTEQAIRIQEVQSNIVRPENYLIWRYGVTEEQAKKMVPDRINISDSFSFNNSGGDE